MAIVVNPTVTQRPNAMNQLALQIIAKRQATNRENEREDLDTQFQTLKGELEALDKSGKLQAMLQSRNPDEVNAARQLMAQYIDVFARRSGRIVSPELLQKETDAALMKYSKGALTMGEKARLSYPGPSESAPTPRRIPASSGASSLVSQSGGVPASGGVAIQPSAPTEPSDSLVTIRGPQGVAQFDKGTLLQKMKDKYKAEGKMFPMSDEAFMQRSEEFVLGDQAGTAGSSALGPDFERILVESGSELGQYTKPQAGSSVPVQAQDEEAAFKAHLKAKYPNGKGSFSPEAIDKTSFETLKKYNSGAYSEFKNGYKPSVVSTPAQISSTPEIAAEAKRQVDSFQAGGDEMFKRIPKVAQSQAKSVQEGKSEYDEIQDKKARGIKLDLKDIFKSRKIERDSFAVMYAQQSTPGFKQITEETKAETRKFIKEADPVELAAAGLATEAEIKNDQERNRINQLIASAQVKVAKLQKDAAANQAYAQVLVKAYDNAFGIISTAITQGKNFKGIQDIRQDPAINDAFNTVAKLMGATVEDVVQMTKTGFFKKKLTAVPDVGFTDPLAALQHVYDTEDSNGKKSSGLDYAASVMEENP